MKQHAMKTIATLGFLFMLTAPAYSQARELKATIPFPFIADEKTLPAGTYRIEPIGKDSGVLVLKEQNSLDTAVVSTMPVQTTVIQEQSKLVFHRYGEDYFLVQILFADRNLGRELSESRAERTIRRNLAKNNSKSGVAQTPSSVGTVTLLAR